MQVTTGKEYFLEQVWMFTILDFLTHSECWGINDGILFLPPSPHPSNIYHLHIHCLFIHDVHFCIPHLLLPFYISLYMCFYIYTHTHTFHFPPCVSELSMCNSRGFCLSRGGFFGASILVGCVLCIHSLAL